MRFLRRERGAADVAKQTGNHHVGDEAPVAEPSGQRAGQDRRAHRRLWREAVGRVGGEGERAQDLHQPHRFRHGHILIDAAMTRAVRRDDREVQLRNRSISVAVSTYGR